MTHRHTADTITDDALDALYASLEEARADLDRYEEVQGEMNERAIKQERDLAALRQVARGYCPACGRGDAAPTVADWEQQKTRADQAEELLAIAHDTSNRSEAERARAAAALARVRALVDEYPVYVDTALLHEALDETTAHPDCVQEQH